MKGIRMLVNKLSLWMALGMLIVSGGGVTADPITQVDGDLDVDGEFYNESAP